MLSGKGRVLMWNTKDPRPLLGPISEVVDIIVVDTTSQQTWRALVLTTMGKDWNWHVLSPAPENNLSDSDAWPKTWVWAVVPKLDPEEEHDDVRLVEDVEAAARRRIRKSSLARRKH